MVGKIFPYATLVTPNKHETEVLVGYALNTPQDMERAARDLLAMGRSRAVLIKGGHSLKEPTATGGPDDVAQDYLLDSEGGKGIWITSSRY